MQKTHGPIDSLASSLFENSLSVFTNTVAAAPMPYLGTFGRAHLGLLTLFAPSREQFAQDHNVALLAFVASLEESELGRRRLASSAVNKWGSMEARWNIASRMLGSADEKVRRLGLKTLSSVLRSILCEEGDLRGEENQNDPAIVGNRVTENPVYHLIAIGRDSNGGIRKAAFSQLRRLLLLQDSIPASVKSALATAMPEIFDVFNKRVESDILARYYAAAGIDPRRGGVFAHSLSESSHAYVELSLFVNGTTSFKSDLIETALSLSRGRIEGISSLEKRDLVEGSFHRFYELARNSLIELSTRDIDFVQWSGQMASSPKIGIYCAGIVLALGDEKQKERGANLLKSFVEGIVSKGVRGELRDMESVKVASSVLRDQISISDISKLLGEIPEPYCGWLREHVYR